MFDDGTFTYLHFPRGAKMPSITVVGSDGQRVTANAHFGTWMDDGNQIQVSQDGCGPIDTAVVHTIAKAVILQYGKQSIEIINTSKE